MPQCLSASVPRCLRASVPQSLSASVPQILVFPFPVPQFFNSSISEFLSSSVPHSFNCLVSLLHLSIRYLDSWLKLCFSKQLGILNTAVASLKTCFLCSQIVLVAIEDSSSRHAEPAVDALKRLGATDPIYYGHRESFAFVGYAGNNKPPWISQKQNRNGWGPSEIILSKSSIG